MNAQQARQLGLQSGRRLLQGAVVVLLAALAFLGLYRHYRAARAVEDAEGWRGAVVRAIDAELGGRERIDDLLDDTQGNVWSMRLGGQELADPLAAAEATAASRRPWWPLLGAALIPVLVTLLLGRVFCSWICPAGLLFEVAGKLRALLRFAELPPPAVRFSLKNKYAVLGAGLALGCLLGLPLFSLFYPPAVLSRIVHAWVWETAFTGMLLLLAVIIAFEVLVSPRWWCRAMCPGGAFWALLGRWRPLRVRLDPERCTSCQRCVPVCEPGIHPVRQSEGIECDNCGVCLRHCPERALRFTVDWPWRRRHDPEPAGRKTRADPANRLPAAPGAPALSILVAAGLFAMISSPAAAHHILGLPHYSYKENYPQAPTLEYPARTGPFDIILTSYPGNPAPGESANLAFYIKNRRSDAPFERSIEVRVLETFTFGESVQVLARTVVEPIEVPHKVSVTFPEDGEYIVELTIEVEGRPETIPFLVVAGKPSAALSWLVALGIALAGFLVAVRAVKIKRARRRRRAGAGRSPQRPAREAAP